MAVLTVAVIAATFSLSAMRQVVNLSDATIAPDGSRIAFVASRVRWDHNRYEDELDVYDMATGRTRRLSAGHASVGNIAWSPDSAQLAAVMDNPKQDLQQLFLIDFAHGTQRELTHGTSVQQIAWEPSGQSIAYTREDSAAPKTGASAFEDAFEVGDNAYLTTEEAKANQIWLTDTSGHEKRVTGGSWSVMDAPLSWSADGRFIVYERAPAVHGLHPLATMWRVDVRTRRSTKVTTHTRDEDGAFYSPDGQHIAYLHPRDSDPAGSTDAWVCNSVGSDDRDASVRLDRFVSTLAWMPDSRRLLLQVDDRTQTPLLVQSLDGAVVARPALGDVTAAAIQPSGSVARNGAIVFIGDAPRHPDELYVLYPHAARPKRLTDLNHATAALDLGRVARVAWRSVDGFEEDGVLTYPPRYVTGRRYPLVLRIHGGPFESSTQAFSVYYQLAASHGYLVFAPNYRGSTDLGSAYLRAIFNDPSTGPGQDVMAGIQAVERLGVVDQTRIGVSGWSYGGQLTSWLEGHYHIWRAAVAGAAVNDLVVDYTIADDIEASRIMFSQWSPFRGDALKLWRDQSPITYFSRTLRRPRSSSATSTTCAYPSWSRTRCSELFATTACRWSSTPTRRRVTCPRVPCAKLMRTGAGWAGSTAT